MNNKQSDNLSYQKNADEVLADLGSSAAGLSHAEALQRIEKYGHNSLTKINSRPIFLKYIGQFNDLMIILLIICALIAFLLGDSRTGGILIAIIFLNSLIGFFQEYRAEKIMSSLKKLVVSEAKVIRSGKLINIDAKDLVPGDVISLEEGDSVPADARIIEENELATNDFALTGESNPCRKFTHAIKKRTSIGHQRNLVFMGTTVAVGNATCVVTATNMHTELGRIAALSQAAKTDLSPLQKEMNNLALKITIITVILTAVLVAMTLSANIGVREALIFAIGIASAMIPQGLPAEVSISLAQAAGKLAKNRAIVKKLSAVETLGSTSIICTDKTGTLTKNEMTVDQITLYDQSYTISGTGYEPLGKVHSKSGIAISHEELRTLEKFLVTGFFATNAKILKPDDTHPSWYCIGDPTEGAIVALVLKTGIDIEALNSGSPELKEFPFDSVRKRMSSIRVYEDKLQVFVKGAPESVLDRCSKIWLPDGKIIPLTSVAKRAILDQDNLLAKKALRNLSFAFKELDKGTNYKLHNPDIVENDLVYMGMVSMMDPLRDEVVAAMQAARKANISVSIITGDSALTAKAIAVKAKLAEHVDDIIMVEEDQLVKLDDKDLLDLVTRGSVIFSRVSPEDKLRIVNLAKTEGHVVAVTGDGINDAPALKRADIGVAMGRTGTDVAKDAAALVLLDDSFHTLIGAVQQGRTVYQNIKKATISCLTSNFGELITVLIGLAALSLVGIPPAITPVLILAVDLIAELFPIAALGWDKSEEYLMTDKPRDPKQHIYDKNVFWDLLFSGLLIGGLAYANYVLFVQRSGISFGDLTTSHYYVSAITMTYVTIVICQLLNILIRRSKSATLSAYLFTNKELWIAMALSMACVIAIVYLPAIQNIFGSGALGVVDWAYALLAGVIFFAVKEFVKFYESFRQKATV